MCGGAILCCAVVCGGVFSLVGIHHIYDDKDDNHHNRDNRDNRDNRSVRAMIDTTLIEQAKRVSVVSLAERRTELRKVTASEYAGACPVCGGTDRFHVNGAGWWFCRNCHPDRGDAIELLRFTEKVGFAEAVTRLTNGVMPVSAQRTTPQPKAATAEKWTDADRSEAIAFLRDAQQALWTNDAATDYLRGRCIEAHTWQAFGLGYADKPAGVGRAFQQPAIVMPWYRAGRLMAIRYRFLDPVKLVDKDGKEELHKIRSWRGSEFSGVLFGGQALAPFIGQSVAEGEQPIERLRTLLIVEGELNCAACWQVAHETGLDVLSLGSESAHLSQNAVRFAQRYGVVMVWADREDVARRLMGTIPGAFGLKSPGGNDANDLLKAGLLGGFLAMNRLFAAKNQDERERFLWQLWDAEQSVSGVDAGTIEVLRSELRRRGE